MERLKIVFLLGTLNADGTQRQIAELLARLNRDRFDLRVLAWQADGPIRAELDARGIPFDCIEFSGLQGKFRLTSYLRLGRLVLAMTRYFRRAQPHLVQSFLFWTNIYGVFAAKLAGVPLIVTGRRSLFDARYMKPHYRWLQNQTNRWTTDVVANACAVRDDCLRHERHLAATRIAVIPNGIDVARYAIKIDARDAKRRLHLPENAPVVGIVGTLSPYKDHATFLRAAQMVLRHAPHTRFLVIGRDEGILTQLQTMCAELLIAHAVRFLGERRDIPDLLAILDILVSSSIIEGLPNAVLEGMAAGKAIAATAVGGTPELIAHEQTGLLVPPRAPAALAAAMLRLLRNPDVRAAYGQAARRRAAEFDISEMVARTEAFYSQLCQHLT